MAGGLLTCARARTTATSCSFVERSSFARPVGATAALAREFRTFAGLVHEGQRHERRQTGSEPIAAITQPQAWLCSHWELISCLNSSSLPRAFVEFGAPDTMHVHESFAGFVLVSCVLIAR